MILVQHKNIYVTIQSSQSNSNRNWIHIYWLNEKKKKSNWIGMWEEAIETTTYVWSKIFEKW